MLCITEAANLSVYNLYNNIEQNFGEELHPNFMLTAKRERSLLLLNMDSLHVACSICAVDIL